VFDAGSGRGRPHNRVFHQGRVFAYVTRFAWHLVSRIAAV
jgi:hypothetical protein